MEEVNLGGTREMRSGPITIHVGGPREGRGSWLGAESGSVMSG